VLNGLLNTGDVWQTFKSSDMVQQRYQQKATKPYGNDSNYTLHKNHQC